jgi:hypothetical protein
VFPFVYQGKSYYQCIDNDRPNYWCATTDNYDINQKWGFCPCKHNNLLSIDNGF